jgi:hypothetical protein
MLGVGNAIIVAKQLQIELEIGVPALVSTSMGTCCLALSTRAHDTATSLCVYRVDSNSHDIALCFIINTPSVSK